MLFLGEDLLVTIEGVGFYLHQFAADRIFHLTWVVIFLVGLLRSDEVESFGGDEAGEVYHVQSALFE